MLIGPSRSSLSSQALITHAENRYTDSCLHTKRRGRLIEVLQPGPLIYAGLHTVNSSLTLVTRAKDSDWVKQAPHDYLPPPAGNRTSTPVQRDDKNHKLLKTGKAYIRHLMNVIYILLII